MDGLIEINGKEYQEPTRSTKEDYRQITKEIERSLDRQGDIDRITSEIDSQNRIDRIDRIQFK